MSMNYEQLTSSLKVIRQTSKIPVQIELFPEVGMPQGVYVGADSFIIK